MNKLEETLLQDFGLDTLAPEAQEAALRDIYETVNLRVGMKLADQMTDEQLATFESLKDKEDEAAFSKWIEETFPNYPELVASELQAYKVEVNNGAADILEASRKKDSSAS